MRYQYLFATLTILHMFMAPVSGAESEEKTRPSAFPEDRIPFHDSTEATPQTTPTKSAPNTSDDDNAVKSANAPKRSGSRSSQIQTIRWDAVDHPFTPATTKPDVTPASYNEVVVQRIEARDSSPLPSDPEQMLNFQFNEQTVLQVDGLVRGFYLNDQRIMWSGVETTFGAEGILRPLIQSEQGNWKVSAEGEFFLNPRFGRSILRDNERDLYRNNFDVDVVELFQLYCQAQRGDFRIRVGKTRTPFGSFQSSMFTNRLIDAPFIRSEVIAWTEVGAFVNWKPGLFTFDVGIINGERELDTNSDKGVVSRVGLDGDTWGIGVSVKAHDGISSEFQKRYNNHVGLDAHVQLGKFRIYGEAIYDEYGFHRDFFGAGAMPRISGSSACTIATFSRPTRARLPDSVRMWA